MNNQNVKTFFTDICNIIAFTFGMAKDVISYFKEENSRERLCLELS